MEFWKGPFFGPGNSPKKFGPTYLLSSSLLIFDWFGACQNPAKLRVGSQSFTNSSARKNRRDVTHPKKKGGQKGNPGFPPPKCPKKKISFFFFSKCRFRLCPDLGTLNSQGPIPSLPSRDCGVFFWEPTGDPWDDFWVVVQPVRWRGMLSDVFRSDVIQRKVLFFRFELPHIWCFPLSPDDYTNKTADWVLSNIWVDVSSLKNVHFGYNKFYIRFISNDTPL